MEQKYTHNKIPKFIAAISEVVKVVYVKRAEQELTIKINHTHHVTT